MIKKSLLIICFSFLFQAQGQTLSEFIHVDQFGYVPNSVKVAVISNPQVGYNSDLSYLPPATLEIRNADTNELVLIKAPTVWNNGATHESSGDKGWWLDFSEITEEGSYYVLDATTNERSSVFNISEAVYTEVLKVAGRMFFYNRCNMAKEEPYAQGWPDTMNFDGPQQDYNTRYIYDPTNAALEKDLSGGWFDAGDYNKYVTFASPVVQDLLWAYKENPIAFGDDWNIPESNNDVPDIIDEVKWELDWMFKMNNPDGSTHLKMGSQNYEENSYSPPSVNTDTRFYSPTCSSASIVTAGLFAHASIVFSEFDDYQDFSAELLQRAIVTYNYAKPFVDTNTLQTDCDDGSIVAGDADRTVVQQKDDFLTAAIYLFAATQEESYHNYIIDNLENATPIFENFWGVGTPMLTDALLFYTTLDTANPTQTNLILNAITFAVSNDFSGFFGFKDSDLYRSHMPEWSYHWGSNLSKARYGNLNTLLVNNNISPNQNESFTLYANEVIHYIHGTNPQGKVYLSNMYEYGAERSVNEIYHLWFYDQTPYDNALTSPIGPAPGYLAGGPNKYFSVPALSPPYGQPDQKSFLDYNDDSPNNSWEITEPAIYYQSSYIRLLANKVDASQLLYISATAKDNKYTIFPNPAKTSITIPELKQDDTVVIFTSEMRRVRGLSAIENNEFDISGLNSGVYFLRITSENGEGFLKLVVE